MQLFALNKGFILLFIFLVLVSHVLATSIMPPHLNIPCDIKAEYETNMTLKLTFRDLIDNNSIRLFTYDGYPNQKVLESLKNICNNDISPVINRLKQGGFGKEFCDFSQDKTKLVHKDKIESIDGWYLGCTIPALQNPLTYLTLPISILVAGLSWIPFFLLFSMYNILLLIPLIILAIILIHLKKKNKLIYALPLTLGLLGGILSYSEDSSKKIRTKLLIVGILISLMAFLIIVIISGFISYL